MSTFLKEIQKQAEGNILVTIYFYGHELFKIRDNFVLKHVFEDTNSFEIDLKNPKEQKFKFEPVKKMQEAIISQFPLQKFKNNVMKLLEDETLTFVDPLDQKKLTNLELVKSFEELGMSIERLYEILFLYEFENGDLNPYAKSTIYDKLMLVIQEQSPKEYDFSEGNDKKKQLTPNSLLAGITT